MNGNAYDNNESSEEPPRLREEMRRLALEVLKRKKFAEAKKMLERQTRIAVLKRRQAQLALKKQIAAKSGQAAKKLALQIARQVIMFVLRIAAAVIASFGFYILIALLIILIIVLVVAGIYYLCNENWLGEAVCSVFK